MAQLAFIVAGLALVGAIASWIAGSVFYARTLHAIGPGLDDARFTWLAILAWPFAIGRLRGAAATHAGNVNKALVALVACMIVAVAAISAATNLSRVSR